LIRSAQALRREGMGHLRPNPYFSLHAQEEVVMHMHDWNTYRQQLGTGVGNLGKLNPDAVKGYLTLSGAGQKTGHLNEKTRELIALAAAISLRCDGCIAVHTASARRLGATKDEIAEALGVAIAINAGAAVVYSTRALDAYDATGEAQTSA
jgi:AhpD family alkylhydroperoxidase